MDWINFFLNEKKCFIEAPKTPPDILRGGHRNPYQLKNTIKSAVLQFFAYITWAKWSTRELCKVRSHHGSSFAVHAVTKDCSSEKGSFILCTYIYIHEAHFTLSYNLI